MTLVFNLLINFAQHCSSKTSPLWEYVLVDSLYTKSRGGCHRFENGNTLIGTGQSAKLLEINENDELEATNLLKSEFPRGSKVKIKPFGFKENVLLAKVFNIKGTKEMTEILVAKDLASEICPS